MFTKVTRVRCDDCLDAVVEVAGGSQAVALRRAREQGWQALADPSGDAWKGKVHVCRRCIEYGRPYKDHGVPQWRGLGLTAQNAAGG